MRINFEVNNGPQVNFEVNNGPLGKFLISLFDREFINWCNPIRVGLVDRKFQSNPIFTDRPY
jgi:hypothetical protein